MKHLLILILLSSCTTQYYRVHTKEVINENRRFGQKEYKYQYTLIKLVTKDTLYIKTDFNYKVKDTIKL